MIDIPTLHHIESAAERIRGRVMRTPLLSSDPLSDLTGHDIFIKPEMLQPGGSFKYRGATNAMVLLHEKNHAEQKEKGVVTASSGNHGIAVALAARNAGIKAGIKATIVIPENAPQVKVERIKRAGATIIRHGSSYGDSEQKAWELEKEGYNFIHPFDSPEVIAGQGTIALEIHRDAPADLDAVLVPVGGGGLISGITSLFKNRDIAFTSDSGCSKISS